MRPTILFFLILFICPPLFAQGLGLDERTKEVCNQVMEGIYQDIFDAKKKYPELEQFDENVLSENQYGIYQIIYEYKKSPEQERRNPFAFGLTIAGIDDTFFQERGRLVFHLAFPVLGLKFVGYQMKGSARYRYDLGEVINQRGVLLADHQQEYMPLKLILRTNNDSYPTNEKIPFVVELKNVSNRHMRVKSLSDKTLFCLFNKKEWGTKQVDKVSQEEEIILKSNESTCVEFLGEAINNPQDIEIYCSYNMSIKGVKPSGILHVKVHKEKQ